MPVDSEQELIKAKIRDYLTPRISDLRFDFSEHYKVEQADLFFKRKLKSFQMSSGELLNNSEKSTQFVKSLLIEASTNRFAWFNCERLKNHDPIPIELRFLISQNPIKEPKQGGRKSGKMDIRNLLICGAINVAKNADETINLHYYSVDRYWETTACTLVCDVVNEYLTEDEKKLTIDSIHKIWKNNNNRLK